jgi:hypothetical protein
MDIYFTIAVIIVVMFGFGMLVLVCNSSAIMKGDTGPQGEKGDTGDRGIQGPKGDQGDPANMDAINQAIGYPVKDTLSTPSIVINDDSSVNIKTVTTFEDDVQVSYGGALKFNRSDIDGNINVSASDSGSLIFSGAQGYNFDHAVYIDENLFIHSLDLKNNTSHDTIVNDGSGRLVFSGATDRYFFDNSIYVNNSKVQISEEGSVRPSNPAAGQTFLDISISPTRPIWYDSVSNQWIDATGTPV